MMFPSHLAATLILGFVLARWFPWDARAWLLAIAFGVLIDIDHLFQLPQYLWTQVPAKGVAAFQPAEMLGYGAAWQGVFHHAIWGTAIVLAASLLFASPIPVVFWGLHMFLDFVVARRFVVFGSGVELAVLAAMIAVLVPLAWGHHQRFGGGAPLAAWARSGLSGVFAAGMAILRR